MDYTSSHLIFKIKKTLRYVQLYGIQRTLIKVKGQYHMKHHYDIMPLLKKTAAKHSNVGLIGCGNFAFSNIAFYLKKNYGNVLRTCMDVDIHRAISLAKEYKVANYTNDEKDIIHDNNIKLVYIASNHASHAEYAIQALSENKNVHIEKPHVVSMDQLLRLVKSMNSSSGKIVGIGFNRPNSKIGKIIKTRLTSQNGASMLNWFVAGHEISPDHWYFKEEEGGRVLGNLCHWIDFIYQMLGPEERYPITIKPTSWVKSDCDIAVTYIFGNGTIAAITFSAKGHTFEGVRERFAAHRGNVLISMDDFQHLTIETIEKKENINLFHRDHGHELSITRSYKFSNSTRSEDACSMKYVWESGELFLRTKEALEKNEIVIVHPFDPSIIEQN